MPVTPEDTPNSEVGNCEIAFFNSCSPCCAPSQERASRVVRFNEDASESELEGEVPLQSTEPSVDSLLVKAGSTEKVEVRLVSNKLCHYAITCADGIQCRVVFIPSERSFVKFQKY